MEKTPFWKKTWFMILAFIFLPPLGIILMWLNKSKWKAFIKIPISIMLAFWSLILGIAFFSPADESAVTESETAAVKEADKEEDLTEQTTNKPAITTKPAASTTRPERTTETATENTTEQQTATNKETTTAKPTTTKPTTTKSPTTAKPTTTTKTTTTKKETTTAKPTTTRPTTTKTPTTVDPESYITVYITKSGEKYHYENPCGNGTYSPISLADAKASGYGACEKCVLH